MGVDEIMATCPLKHEIRVNLWVPYIKKLNKTPISYLTLYSPPLMDVKYLEHCKLIEEKDGVYKQVVGVGIDAEGEANTVSQLDKRLELLLSGNINNLINGTIKTAKVKQLEDKFPFDVINLDYTDTLHRQGLNTQISPHILAISNIFEKQKKGKVDQFVLFLTAFVAPQHYNQGFIDYLKELIDINIRETPNFGSKLERLFNCNNSNDYYNNHTNECFAVALTKVVLHNMHDYHFTLEEGEIKWLIRDENMPERRMLHLAFYIKEFIPPPITKRANIGQRKNDVKNKSVQFLKASYHTLRETEDRERLNRKHQKQITEFNRLTFELNVPTPKTNNE
ncbi:MAG: hypothetical protein JSS96_02315 [Bacteroidetes bacterium]|nr:hypothetical protein [Bacteroidota bacterium]